MTVSAISYYRGGSSDNVGPLARRMRAVLLAHGVLEYRVGRVQTGAQVGAWMVEVKYADWAAYATVMALLEADPEHRKIVDALGGIVSIVSRDFVVDLAL